MKNRILQFSHKLFNEIDVASIVFFRIVFGLFMLWEVIKHFAHGWIYAYFIEPDFHFTYYMFEWVSPLPGNWMYILFAILGILSIFIALGLFYRLSITLFFLGFSYVFLIEQARYLNHFYLIILLSFLLIFIPANRHFSLDALRNPNISTSAVPAWSLWLLRMQFGIPYFFGGIAKLNADWLKGTPIQIWNAKFTSIPLIGPLITGVHTTQVMAYSALIFDLMVVPFLIWKKTRRYAFSIAVIFHVWNSFMFNIGIFPWLMIAGTSLFFSPDWPRHFINSFKKIPTPKITTEPRITAQLNSKQKRVITLVSAYLIIQILVPLRHFLYPGQVHWTQEGHRFSWHMLVRSMTGVIDYMVVDLDTGHEYLVIIPDHVSDFQGRKLSKWPDMILQFAHHIEEGLASEGMTNIAIYPYSIASLNNRPPQNLIKPINLITKERSLLSADWIEQLIE